MKKTPIFRFYLMVVLLFLVTLLPAGAQTDLKSADDAFKSLDKETVKIKGQPQKKKAPLAVPQNVETSGRITINGIGAGGYIIVAFDRDIGPGGQLLDVPIGVTLSRFDDPGKYSIVYNPLLYAAQDMEEDGRAVKPDIFVKVMTRPGEWRKSGLRIDVATKVNQDVNVDLNAADLIAPEDLPENVGIENFAEWFLNNVREDPEEAFRGLLAILTGHATHWPIDLSITPGTGNANERLICVPKKQASGFNVADVDSRFEYNDTGKRYDYKIDDQGQVLYTLNPEIESPTWRLLPSGDARFDMIAASGNRVLAKEVDSFKFWFCSPRFEYDHHVQPNGQENPVPGFFIKLNPDYGPTGVSGPWWNTLHYDHPSLGELFSLAPILNAYVTDMQMVMVGPEKWQEVNTTPPCGSSQPPPWVHTFTRARYEVTPMWMYLIPPPLPRPGPIPVNQPAIRVYAVQDIGLGFTHRHAQYEDIGGGEMDHPQSMVNAPPIIDRAGFYDGTCNFFALCRLKTRSKSSSKKLKDSYGILWTDEQTYFSDRWRILHPEDSNWRSMRAGKPFYDLLMQGAGWPYYEDWGPKAWCPFRAEGNYIDDSSRMAVAKQVILVSGPDPKSEGQSLIHSMNFSWGSRDYTWRWRRCGPQDARSAHNQDTGHDHVVFPQTMGIREDMTIFVEGLAREYDGYRLPLSPVRGYWYQKYLPADNWEVPSPDDLHKDRMSTTGYTHPWRFITAKNFQLADGFSHFGVYDPVDSRGQYYTISIPYAPEWRRSLSLDDFPSLLSENIRWEDVEGRLSPNPLFEQHVTLKIAKRYLTMPDGQRRFGLVAMHWDKRNDDMVPLGGSPVMLERKSSAPPGAPTKIQIHISKHYRQWSPPVVQKATIGVDPDHKKVKISYLSKLTLERRSDSLQEGKVRRIPITPRTDTSIWRVKIYAFDLNGKRILLFDKDVSKFSYDDNFTYSYEWVNPHTDAEGHPLDWNTLLNQYLSPKGRIDAATSIVFEDIVGHMATPESVYFEPWSSATLRPRPPFP